MLQAYLTFYIKFIFGMVVVFHNGLTTYFIEIVTQLPWQKYDTSTAAEDVSNPFCPREQPYLE